MHYAAATRYLYALAPRGVQLGLARVEAALAQRGHPELAVPALLVAGTNGKGSVAAMLASVLRASGRRVGLYTSPHLHRLVERFQVDGEPLSQRELARRVSELAPWLEQPSTPPLTFFEVCTLIAFEVFRDRQCDLAVLEVGLGGRLDATNVVTPKVSVITRIALDHADRLGTSLELIAGEKAGIIKPGVPLVTGVREAELLSVIEARARELGAPVWAIDRDFAAQREGGSSYRAQVGEQRYAGLELALAGGYQADNLACVLATLGRLAEQGSSVDARALREGLSQVRWPGRLELIEGAPSVLLDAAHNPDACVALTRHLTELRARFGRLVLLFGVLADKPYAEMLQLLLPAVDGHVFTTPPTPRALPARQLHETWGGESAEEPLTAFERARALAGERGLVVVAGSIFVMAQVRAHLLGLPSDPPIAM